MPSRSVRPNRAPSPHGQRAHLLLATATLALTGIAAAPAAGGPLQVTDRVVGAAAVRAIDDISGDGKPDYALATGGAVKVVFGTRDLSTDLAAVRALTAGGPASLEVRSSSPSPGPITFSAPRLDFDGDGVFDLTVRTDRPYVVYGGPATGVVTVETSTRATAITQEAASPGSISRVGDFNGDGKDDLLYLPQSETPDAIVLGGPRAATVDARAPGRSIQIGTLRSCTVRLFLYLCTTRKSPVRAVGDINGDGKVDLYLSDRTFIALGRSSTAAIPATGPDANGIDVAVPTNASAPDLTGGGDVTGDGIGDLSLSQTSATGAGVLRILPGRRRGPGGAITPATDPAIVLTSPARTWLSAGTVGDVDGDPRPDLLTTIPGGGLMTFSTPPAAPASVELGVGPAIPGVPTGDLAGDGKVVSNNPAPQFAGDVDGDGLRDLVLTSSGLDYGGLDAGALLFATHGADRATPELVQPGLVTPERGTSLSPSTFSAASGAPGTRLRLVLTEPADVELTYRRSDGTALATERRADLPAGVTETVWDGQGRGVDGRPGSYLLDLVPVDAAGNRGARVRVAFTVTGQIPGARPTLTITQRTEIAAGVTPPDADQRYGSEVWGTCPNTVGVNVEPGKTVDVDLGGAVESDTCKLTHENQLLAYHEPASLDGWPWRTTVSINGGPERDITGFDAPNVAPEFALRPGANTVVFTDRYDGRGYSGRMQATENGRWFWRGAGVLDIASGEMRLTTATANQRGGMISFTAVDPNALDIQFDAVITGGRGSGNGLAVGFVDTTRGNFPGLPGGANVGLGWTGWPGPSVGLVTVKGTLNPAENFVGLMTGAVGPGGYPVWLKTADPGKSLAFSTSRVRVRTKDGMLTVWIDGRQVLQHQITLPRFMSVGFSAATGGASRSQSHVVKNLSITTS